MIFSLDRRLRSLVAFWAGGFLLHLAWEVAQMPLFISADGSFWENFLMCLSATATGDMLFMLTLYLTLAVIHRDVLWVTDRMSYRHPATWVVPVLVGVLLAVGFELWAIYAVGRWQYGSMPVIPVLGVGVTPVLQMIVVPLLTLALSRAALRMSRPAGIRGTEAARRTRGDQVGVAARGCPHARSQASQAPTQNRQCSCFDA